MFLKPEGQRLHVLVRMPLSAIRDVEFPTRAAGLLDLARADPTLHDGAMLWLVPDLQIFEAGTRLAEPRIVQARVSLPSDRSFTSYEQALAHVNGPPLAADTQVYANQLLFDVLLEYPIASDRSRFALHPAFGRLGIQVATVLRFLPPEGPIHTFEYTGDPGLVRLDPTWYEAAQHFVGMGFFEFLNGRDNLLVLFCLIVPFVRARVLVSIVVSFAIAHSMTLAASAFKLAPNALWFPPLVDTLIAASILYIAVENMIAPGLERRWAIAFGCGLVYGFGFSFALPGTLQFAGSHVLVSRVAFNLGLELGLLAALVVLVPLLRLLFRVVVAGRMGTILGSALAAHTAWHSLLERADRLGQFRFQWPVLDAALAASAIRWLMLLIAVAGVAWLALGVLGAPRRRGTGEREGVA